MSFEHPIQPCLPALFSDAPAPSFTEVVALIPTWTDLDETRRRDMKSALTAVGRITGRPLANLRCDPAELNALIFQRTAASCGLGTSRFQSVLTLLRVVLRRLGRHAPREQGEAMLGDTWRSFLERLPPDSALRAGLRRLARWGDVQSVMPMIIDDAHFSRFLEQDSHSRVSAAIADQGRNISRAWNTAIKLQAEPALFRGISAPRKREPYTLPLTAYPQSFQDDVERFISERRRVERPISNATTGLPSSVPAHRRFRLPEVGPFTARVDGSRGRRKKWKPSTVASRSFSILQAAAALYRTGTPIEEIRGLRDLVQPVENAMVILEFYDNGVLLSKGGQIGQIGEVLRQLATSLPGIPDEDRVAIEAWAQDVAAPRQHQMGPKAYKCLRALIQPRARAVLMHLPKELVLRSKEPDLTAVERAQLVRTAVIISILTCIPVRVGNLHKIHLIQHLARLDGTRRPSHLLIESCDVKNEAPIQSEISRGLAQLLQDFIDNHRPHLAEEGNPYLFPGVGQQPYSISGLRHAFKSTVERETGVPVYPHAMRHFAGWLLLKRHPGAYEMVRRLLGHRDVETTIRFYLGLENDAAGQAHDVGIIKELRETRLLAQATFKRNRPAMRRRKSES